MRKKLHQEIKNFFLAPKIPLGIFFAFLIFSVVVTWCGATIGTTERTANLFVRHVLGEQIVTANLSFIVHSVRHDFYGAGPLVPKKGYEFVATTITLRNDSSVPFDLIPLLHFHLKDLSGNVYNTVAIPSETNQLSGPLLPHDKIREEIGFEVLKNAQGLTLYFEPGISDHAIIAIDLATPKRWGFFKK